MCPSCASGWPSRNKQTTSFLSGATVVRTSPRQPKARKLSYKEQRELQTLPARIAALEAEQASIQSQLADATLYASDNAKALQLAQRNAAFDGELPEALERWEILGA